PFGERLEPVTGPERRAPGHLVHQPVAEPELAGESLNVAVGREESVGSALDEEPVASLGQNDATRAPLALEHDDLRPRPGQLPRGRQAGEAGPDDDARHTQPRSVAVRRARSASAATSSGSSFNESVRSGRLCAVNSTCTAPGTGKRCSARLTRSATASRNLGWSPQLRTRARSRRPRAASSSFFSYAPTDRAE